MAATLYDYAVRLNELIDGVLEVDVPSPEAFYEIDKLFSDAELDGFSEDDLNDAADQLSLN